MALEPAQAEAMDQNLIARWTFQNGSLKSDVGDFELQEGGRGAMEVGKRSVTLRDRKFLFCPEISSTALPELRKSVTIWARVKFDELPKEGDLGVFGLMVGQGAGSWRDFTFNLLCRSLPEDPAHAGLAFFARTEGGGEVGVGVRRYQPVSADEFVNVAIVFNSANRTAGMWVSSTRLWVESKVPADVGLQDFGAFLIGKLMAPGAETAITFDEVRVYSTALDAQWLEEISPEAEN